MSFSISTSLNEEEFSKLTPHLINILKLLRTRKWSLTSPQTINLRVVDFAKGKQGSLI